MSSKLEHGGIFREYGIRNFLEGDFFRWYLSAWNTDIEKEVSQMAQRLAEYDPGTIELAPENARDLLKDRPESACGYCRPNELSIRTW